MSKWIGTPVPKEPITFDPIVYPYHYAKYTMQLRDVLKLYPTILDNLHFDTEEDTNKFISMFKSKWAIYEIGGETIDEFQTFIENVFNEYKDYYEEMLRAYKTEINMLDGIKTNITFVDTKNEETELHTEGDSENKQYGLPNKTTSTDYMTSKDRVNTSGNEQYSGTTTRNNTINRSGGVNVIELKREYMNLIRNLYSEFADKFQKCFITLY